MSLETWLFKVKKTISHTFDPSTKKSKVGVLSFEIAGSMSKLLHLWQAISDRNMDRLYGESICLEGVRKIVSNNDTFLLSLACAEFVENLKLVAKSVSRVSRKCEDSSLRCFDMSLDDFANTGRDRHSWLMGSKEIESKNKKLDRFVTLTANLRREMDQLAILENSLKKLLQSKDHDTKNKEKKIIDLKYKIVVQKQEVKYLKEKSLWFRSFDTVTSLLARCVFTILARIKLVFRVGNIFPTSIPRSLSTSALVHPSENPNTCEFISGPLIKTREKKLSENGFFKSNSEIIKPPSGTLGAAALALQYANLIVVLEKMIESPQLVGFDARDDLYSMLPKSIRFSLRAQLKGVGFSASDLVLANEWRNALKNILRWLSPLAHNMIKWQNERSFEQRTLVHKSNVVLLQTMYFANQEKTEAAMTELLVGLNYIWRFERQRNEKALFGCVDSDRFLNSENF